MMLLLFVKNTVLMSLVLENTYLMVQYFRHIGHMIQFQWSYKNSEIRLQTKITHTKKIGMISFILNLRLFNLSPLVKKALIQLSQRKNVYQLKQITFLISHILMKEMKILYHYYHVLILNLIFINHQFLQCLEIIKSVKKIMNIYLLQRRE